jgi:hypothetical protein
MANASSGRYNLSIMPQVSSIKGHFDGRSVVLDEPASLEAGQAVRIVFDPAPALGPAPPSHGSRAGFAKGALEAAFTPFVDMTATLMNGDTWDESAALHIDPLDAVAPDFVRRPGSAAGQIKTSDDFGDTPEEFEEHL